MLRLPYLMARRYFRHNVGIQSAALAFYLLFSLFPFLIFISALLGLLRLDVTAVLLALGEFLPREVVDIIRAYLIHVNGNASLRLMLFGLLFSIWFPMRAANALLLSVRTAYHLGAPRRAVVHRVKTLVYTVLLIGTIAVTLALMSIGDRALTWAVGTLGLPAEAAGLWARLRFPAAGLAGYFALFSLYALAQDALPPWGRIWPGAMTALGGWLGLSWLYALYVERIADYSLLYGSIGAVMVLMIWLYMTANVLILGAELNGALAGLGRDREPGLQLGEN